MLVPVQLKCQYFEVDIHVTLVLEFDCTTRKENNFVLKPKVTDIVPIFFEKHKEVE